MALRTPVIITLPVTVKMAAACCVSTKRTAQRFCVHDPYLERQASRVVDLICLPFLPDASPMPSANEAPQYEGRFNGF